MQARTKPNPNPRPRPAHRSIALSLNSISASPDHSPTRASGGDSSPSHHSSDSSVAFSSNLPEGLREEHATVETFRALLNPNRIESVAAVMIAAFDVALTLRFGLNNYIKKRKVGREITVQIAQWYLQHAAQLKAYPAAHAIGLCAEADCNNIPLPVPGTSLAGIKEANKARALELFKEAYALVKQHNLNLPYAMYARGQYETKAEEAKRYLEEAVKQDNVFAQGALAHHLYSRENSSNADFMRAEELAQAAAESGDAFGKAKLATLLKWRADRIQKENPNEAAGLRTKVTIWHVRAQTQGEDMDNDFFNRFTAAYPAPVLTGCMILRRERYDVDSTISTIEAQHPEAAKQVYEAFTSQSTTTAEERAWLQERIKDLSKPKSSKSSPSKSGHFAKGSPEEKRKQKSGGSPASTPPHSTADEDAEAEKKRQSRCGGGGCSIM